MAEVGKTGNKVELVHVMTLTGVAGEDIVVGDYIILEGPDWHRVWWKRRHDDSNVTTTHPHIEAPRFCKKGETLDVPIYMNRV